MLALTTGAATADDERINRAVVAAQAWLTLADSGKFAEAYNQASSYMREVVTREKFGLTTGRLRIALGKVTRRQLWSKEFTTSIPNSPAGEYVVLRYETVFQKREGVALETITPMKDKDGVWRVGGYYVKYYLRK